jgi:hypothetical protein
MTSTTRSTKQSTESSDSGQSTEVKDSKAFKPRGALPKEGYVLEFHISDPNQTEGPFRLVAETQHSWSYMAGYTRGGEGRESTKELIARVIKENGVTDPMVEPVTVTILSPKGPRIIETLLIEGRTLADGRTVVKGKLVAPKAEPAKRAPRARKAPAKKAAA